MELNNHNNTKQTLKTAIENEHHLECLSDTDSTNSEADKNITYSSPVHFHSNSDSDSDKSETNNKASKTSALTESEKNNKATKASALSESPARSSISSDQISLPHESLTLEDSKPEPVVKRSVKEESLAVVKADPIVTDGTDSVGEGGNGGDKQRRRVRPPGLSVLRKGKNDEMVKKAGLGFRVFGFLFCLVSFSVMVADRNQGWALDSFQRYKEFRYCMSVNVIGFVYSGAQAFDLAYQSATGRNLVQHHLRYIVDFALDQMVTYLLISASSSAATRIDDWQLNWGKDKFPDMASVSVAMSFLAFAALAFSSLISGHVLCNSKST